MFVQKLSTVPSLILFVLPCIIPIGCGDDGVVAGDDEVCDAGDSDSDTGGCATPIELESCSTLDSYVTDAEPCSPCHDECHKMYWCFNGDGSQPTGGCPICAENDLAANNICQSEDFLNDANAYAQEQPCYLCSNYCSGWNPANEITVNGATGLLEIEQTFIDSVLADPTKLSSCDTARAKKVPTGLGYEITNAAAGDLLYELGLRNGDIPLEINNYPLDDLIDVTTAVVALSFSDPSSYTIEVYRPGTTGTLFITVGVI